MKKNCKFGFTLTEAVITMTIIGVVSALLLPMANKFRPDPLKVKYLQTYDAITYVASQLANDQAKFGSLYNPNDPANPTARFNVSEQPFADRVNTFCNLFAQGVNAPTGTECRGENGEESSIVEFITDNNIAWSVNATSSKNLAQFEGTFLAEIQVWLNGDRDDNSQHFTFEVGADGQTYITDRQGLAYAATRSSWKNSDYNLNNYTVERPDDYNKVNYILAMGEYEVPLPDLPEGQAWADWVTDLKRMRHTYCKGVYCESVRADGYSYPRHVYWHPEAKKWVELLGEGHINQGEYEYPEYDGPDKGDISEYGKGNW